MLYIEYTIITHLNSLQQEWESADIEFVKHGDLIRLEHILTRRNVHSHQEPAPLSKKQFQVQKYNITLLYISKILLILLTDIAFDNNQQSL